MVNLILATLFVLYLIFMELICNRKDYVEKVVDDLKYGEGKDNYKFFGDKLSI